MLPLDLQMQTYIVATCFGVIYAIIGELCTNQNARNKQCQGTIFMFCIEVVFLYFQGLLKMLMFTCQSYTKLYF